MRKRQNLLQTSDFINLAVVLELGDDLESVAHEGRLDILIQLRQGLFNVTIWKFLVRVNIK